VNRDRPVSVASRFRHTGVPQAVTAHAPSALAGETITLNGQPWEVVGITPPRLSAPFSQVQVLAPRVFEVSGLTADQIWNGAGHARLKAGVSLQLSQRLSPIATAPDARAKASEFTFSQLTSSAIVAEGEGFEPPERFPVQWFSRPPPSTTRPSLRSEIL
jgi:hypothetical protein